MFRSYAHDAETEQRRPASLPHLIASRDPIDQLKLEPASRSHQSPLLPTVEHGRADTLLSSSVLFSVFLLLCLSFPLANRRPLHFRSSSATVRPRARRIYKYRSSLPVASSPSLSPFSSTRLSICIWPNMDSLIIVEALFAQVRRHPYSCDKLLADLASHALAAPSRVSCSMHHSLQALVRSRFPRLTLSVPDSESALHIATKLSRSRARQDNLLRTAAQPGSLCKSHQLDHHRVSQDRDSSASHFRRRRLLGDTALGDSI